MPLKECVQEVKKILEDSPDEVNPSKNALAMVNDDINQTMNEMSLAMHTIKRQIDNINRKVDDRPNFYNTNNSGGQQNNRAFQSFQSNRGNFSRGPRGRGNFPPSRPRAGNPQPNNPRGRMNRFTPSRGRAQQYTNYNFNQRLVCHYCFKPGHIQRDCWAKHGRNNYQPNRGNYQPVRHDIGNDRQMVNQQQ